MAIWCSLALLLTGCAATEVKMNQIAQGQVRQAEQLTTQEQVLKSQAEQMTALAAQQAEVKQAVTELASQVRMTNMQLASLSMAPAQNTASMPALAEAPDSSAKSVKKPRKETKVEPETGKDSAKLVIGRVEWVWIEALNKKLKARVDTGATLSSIHATKIERFERDGKNWVRFTMQVNAEGEQGVNSKDQDFEAPLARNAKIRQASSEEIDARPVVRLRMRLGHLEEEVDFTLTNRSEMNYPILLGRRFLQDIAVVDVSLKFTQPLEIKAKP